MVRSLPKQARIRLTEFALFLCTVETTLATILATAHPSISVSLKGRQSSEAIRKREIVARLDDRERRTNGLIIPADLDVNYLTMVRLDSRVTRINSELR